MASFVKDLGASFNTTLLRTTWVFGLITALSNFLFTVMLCLWVDRPDVIQIEHAPMGSA